jgi:hypothetical protein
MIAEGQYTIRCCAPGCDVTHVERWQQGIDGGGEQPPRPCLPVDWSRIVGGAFCPKHRIEARVTIDDKVETFVWLPKENLK